jgi:hypothetical protein
VTRDGFTRHSNTSHVTAAAIAAGGNHLDPEHNPFRVSSDDASAHDHRNLTFGLGGLDNSYTVESSVSDTSTSPYPASACISPSPPCPQRSPRSQCLSPSRFFRCPNLLFPGGLVHSSVCEYTLLSRLFHSPNLNLTVMCITNARFF